jgi:hypothetical protein
MPDPRWPPPPYGWNFWIADGKPFWRRKRVLIPAAAVVALFAVGSFVEDPQTAVDTDPAAVTSVATTSPTPVRAAVAATDVAAPPTTGKAEPRATTTKPPAPKPTRTKRKTTAPKPEPKPKCDPNYGGGCVPIADDVDCAGGSGNGPEYFSGVAQVIGSDIYDLDRDNDGDACESN